MKPYFVPVGKPSGDATRNYRVDGVKGYFVHEFIDYIQENHKEWGTIAINTGDKSWFWWKDGLCTIEYDFANNNKFIIKQDKTKGQWQDYIIKDIIANGGWSLMDYWILVEPYDEGLA